jgi:hypothetical protein
VRRSTYLGLLVVTALLSAGCAKPYRSNAPENLYLSTQTQGGLLSSVKVGLDIHQLDERCQTEYLGRVRLGGESVALGLDVNRPAYLVFEFMTSAWLANSSSSIAYDTVFTPRPGHAYDIDVTYVEELYEVAIRERNRKTGRANLLDRRHCDQAR